MRRVLTWVGIVVGGLLAVVVFGLVGIFVVSNQKLNQHYTVAAATVAVPTDSASIVRGQHLTVAITKCVDCHGQNLGGAKVLDAGPVAVVYAPNITRGQGSVVATYTPADWARAIRHGVGQSGRGLLLMPSDELAKLSDDDLGALLAYVTSVPPVDNRPPPSEVRPLGHVLNAFGQLPLIAAARIDHANVHPGAAPPAGPTAAYGAYLVNVGGCTGCHNAALSGGRVPGTPPELPPASNLTPGGAMAGWTEEDFRRALRTGRRPNGSTLNPFMPWEATAKMTDDEIRALWLHLQTVPARPTGER
ncbi:MAG: cytochrome c [Chloroflexi bacterium]|nr:cytochrome c [Chloroflexota bacterium]